MQGVFWLKSVSFTLLSLTGYAAATSNCHVFVSIPEVTGFAVTKSQNLFDHFLLLFLEAG